MSSSSKHSSRKPNAVRIQITMEIQWSACYLRHCLVNRLNTIANGKFRHNLLCWMIEVHFPTLVLEKQRDKKRWRGGGERDRVKMREIFSRRLSNQTAGKIESVDFEKHCPRAMKCLFTYHGYFVRPIRPNEIFLPYYDLWRVLFFQNDTIGHPFDDKIPMWEPCMINLRLLQSNPRLVQKFAVIRPSSRLNYKY